MGTISIVHWLIVLIVVASMLAPPAIILKKAGFSPWWALLSLLPIVNLIALWVFALVRWPTEKQVNA